jgi:hypothetical protein
MGNVKIPAARATKFAFVNLAPQKPKLKSYRDALIFGIPAHVAQEEKAKAETTKKAEEEMAEEAAKKAEELALAKKAADKKIAPKNYSYRDALILGIPCKTKSAVAAEKAKKAALEKAATEEKPRCEAEEMAKAEAAKKAQEEKEKALIYGIPATSVK